MKNLDHTICIKEVSLDNLYLDPNNYRLRDKMDYEEVDLDDIENEKIQNRTLDLLIGYNDSGISDLHFSYIENGYLLVDTIQVIPLKGDKYKVLDGNRRIATLKYLYKKFNEYGYYIGKLNPQIFSAVPVVVNVQKDEMNYDVLMGLKHIFGLRKWSLMNLTYLISTFKEKYNKRDIDLYKSLGLSPQEQKYHLITLYFIDKYKESDYGKFYKTTLYSLFNKISRFTNIKRWLGWSDDDLVANNIDNLDKLFSWMSTDFNIDSEGSLDTNPIIKDAADIYYLEKFINDVDSINLIDEKRNILEAYISSSYSGSDIYAELINKIEKNIIEVDKFSKHVINIEKNRLLNIKNKIDELLSVQTSENQVVSKGISKTILCNSKTEHFSSISFNNYKGFKKNLKVSNLNKINIIAGDNNVGKSSFLEAIYLLANMNDINELLDLYRRRGKFVNKFSAQWIKDEFKAYNLSGVFAGKDVEIFGQKINEEDLTIDKSDYLTSINITSSFDKDKEFNSTARLFLHKGFEQSYEKIASVCATTFSSPFSILNKELINEYHEKCIDNKVYDDIIGFIRENIDSKIKAIHKVGDDVRFKVEHDDFKEAVDLTQFGEGLQRIFYISLQISSAENGIMCIDEIENAIHHSLLVKFTGFIQKIAERFNVQLFITTHSNECIKAFFENEYNNQDINGYRLEDPGSGVTFKAAKGENLRNQIDNFNLDLRG